MVRAAGIEPARGFPQRIFLPPTAFAAARKRLWSGLSLHPGVAALGAARLVSTPSRFRAWLGIAICKVSPNLSSSASAVSRESTQSQLSPLRLPIPPRPHLATYTAKGIGGQHEKSAGPFLKVSAPIHLLLTRRLRVLRPFFRHVLAIPSPLRLPVPPRGHGPHAYSSTGSPPRVRMRAAISSLAWSSRAGSRPRSTSATPKLPRLV
jgi:hypothetical protein